MPPSPCSQLSVPDPVVEPRPNQSSPKSTPSALSRTLSVGMFGSKYPDSTVDQPAAVSFWSETFNKSIRGSLQGLRSTQKVYAPPASAQTVPPYLTIRLWPLSKYSIRILAHDPFALSIFKIAFEIGVVLPVAVLPDQISRPESEAAAAKRNAVGVYGRRRLSGGCRRGGDRGDRSDRRGEFAATD